MARTYVRSCMKMATPPGSHKPRFDATKYANGWRAIWYYKRAYAWCPMDHWHKSKRDALLCAQKRYLNYREQQCQN